jgi:hypothetical protein
MEGGQGMGWVLLRDERCIERQAMQLAEAAEKPTGPATISPLGRMNPALLPKEIGCKFEHKKAHYRRKGGRV